MCPQTAGKLADHWLVQDGLCQESSAARGFSSPNILTRAHQHSPSGFQEEQWKHSKPPEAQISHHGPSATFYWTKTVTRPAQALWVEKETSPLDGRNLKNCGHVCGLPRKRSHWRFQSRRVMSSNSGFNRISLDTVEIYCRGANGSRETSQDYSIGFS